MRPALLLITAAAVTAGCGSSHKTAQSPTTTAGTQSGPGITLLVAAHNDGPWARTLTLALGKAGVPRQFNLCGVYGAADPTRPCVADSSSRLPAGATFRLEQQPFGPGVERPDTPGWGLVGTADARTFELSLSDFVSTNNTPDTVTYRATLRDPDGDILGTSNTVTVTWHR
jgi:hypothetical protein